MQRNCNVIPTQFHLHGIRVNVWYVIQEMNAMEMKWYWLLIALGILVSIFVLGPFRYGNKTATPPFQLNQFDKHNPFFDER